MKDNWQNFWKADWDQTRERLIAWWRHEGLALNVLAHRTDVRGNSINTQAPFYYLMSGLDTQTPYASAQAAADAWTDAVGRAKAAERNLATFYYGAEAFPLFDTHLGPGSLATFLGAEPEFALETVWYAPCIADPDHHPALVLDQRNPWFIKQKAVLEAGMDISQGRFLVSMPDLIENVDTLASLRGTQELMMDFMERPDWVKQRLAEINQVYFEAFDCFYDLIRDPWGGNSFSAFCIWGPGKTAKVQCDLAAMISPRMLVEFVVPALAEQCAWLDYSMYHLDGTQAIPHLDALLDIDALDAIEWTPQVSVEQGGHPRWFAMYRKILAAGKSVQLVGVTPDEVIPLLDAIGTQGVFLIVNAASEAEARALVDAVEAYH